MKKSCFSFCSLLIIIFVLTNLSFGQSTDYKPVTIRNSSGEKVILTQIPQRLVQAGRAASIQLNTLYLFPEAKNRIVAMADSNQGRGNFIKLLDPNFHNKKILKRNANIEQIIAERPELVIMKSFLAKKLGRSIERLGLPVLYMHLETPNQFYKEIKLIGKIYNNPKHAADVVDYFKTKENKVKSVLAKLPASKKPKALLLYYSQRDGNIAFNVPPLNWMQTILLKSAGAIPAWENMKIGKRWTKVGFEQIASWDSDYIFVISYRSNTQTITNRLIQDPRWQNLRATRENKVIAFPSDFHSWDQPDTRWILGLGWLAAQMYPSQFSNYDLQLEAKQFYRDLYRINEHVFEEKILPLLGETL